MIRTPRSFLERFGAAGPLASGGRPRVVADASSALAHRVAARVGGRLLGERADHGPGKVRMAVRAGLSNARPGAAAADPFTRDIVRLVATFFSVVAVDALVVSLMTHRLRVWFPLWLDPSWATRSDPWVVYSQSYLAGVFLLPVLSHIVDRDFLARRHPRVRAAFWATCLGVLAFVGWWKGSLMVEHNKQREAIGWAALTALMWTIISIADVMPERLRTMTRGRLLGALLLGVSCFFLVMAVLDPLVQLRVQHIGWSSGLIIEMGFFVPAGILLLLLSRKLRRA